MPIRWPKITWLRGLTLKRKEAPPTPAPTVVELDPEKAITNYYNAMKLDREGFERLARERGFGGRLPAEKAEELRGWLTEQRYPHPVTGKNGLSLDHWDHPQTRAFDHWRHVADGRKWAAIIDTDGT